MKRPGRPEDRGRPARSLAVRPASDAVADALALRGITDEVRAGRVLTEWSAPAPRV